MQIDLADETSIQTVRSQVCVIGAGIAGLTLVRKLSQQNIDVVLLEAGGHSIEVDGQRLFEAAKLSGQIHVGTREGRFRVFGGTSLRWGGQVLGMSNVAAAGWPIAWDELTKYSAEAERLLGVDELSFEAAEFFRILHEAMPAMLRELEGVDARVSKWMTFSRRNLAGTLGGDLFAELRVRVYLHAQVTELLLAHACTHIEAAIVRDAAGTQIRFEAEQFVLAAGTVETSRLLLASRSVAPQGVGNGHDRVGRNFHDHVTLPVATMTGPARERVLREIRPWVFGGTVHSAKLEASKELRERLGLNPILAHVAINEPEGTGVAVVRELLTALQRGDYGRALTTNAMGIPQAGVEAFRLAWDAKVQHRRFVSRGATVKLQLNVAQDMPSRSRITLGDATDAYGVPEVMVDWRVTDNELASLRKYAGYLKGRFEAMSLTGVAWVPEILVPDAALPDLGDARHAMGGACMGTDPQCSVVDPELAVHGIVNLSIAGAATFPTGEAQLPTLTMMALSLRLGERLAGLVGK